MSWATPTYTYLVPTYTYLVSYLDPGEELGHALLRPLDAKGRRNVPQEVALRDRPVHVADHHLSTLTERDRERQRGRPHR